MRIKSWFFIRYKRIFLEAAQSVGLMMAMILVLVFLSVLIFVLLNKGIDCFSSGRF
ncbi:Uncharacterised protein [Serratia entomophila]|nr:Uncharacterised protein [Serratia entomophila]CAI0985757.1 Uncharacterised protein [Serratia entomophila]CAI1594441.1 Uncharacterised protein [Serratia entomophila]CAI1731906.1 Uncharacterised protein [Serratia entomophila]CAI1745229.1 Uncharacterised protein [Serratia entomophila]